MTFVPTIRGGAMSAQTAPRYPLRLLLALFAYAFLLVTDRYPPFSLDP